MGGQSESIRKQVISISKSIIHKSEKLIIKCINFKIVKMWNCHYHPETQLQNFCANTHCSLPMCPKCIHVHLHDTSQQHHILPLGDTISMMKQQILTCLQGLSKQKQLIEVEYNPQHILENYDTLIQKHKTQTITEIERYYRSLKEQMLLNLNNLYSETLAQLNYPIQQKIDLLQRYLKNLQNKSTIIETIININSQSQIQHTELFFKTIRERKNTMATLLPRLEVRKDGKLHMPLYNKNNSKKVQAYEPQVYVDEPISGIQKIMGLQERLLSLRSIY